MDTSDATIIRNAWRRGASTWDPRVMPRFRVPVQQPVSVGPEPEVMENIAPVIDAVEFRRERFMDARLDVVVELITGEYRGTNVVISERTIERGDL